MILPKLVVILCVSNCILIGMVKAYHVCVCVWREICVAVSALDYRDRVIVTFPLKHNH